MRKILFIDRDGTLVYEPDDEQLDSFEKLRFLPGVMSWLGKIASELSYELVMVTNQDGLGTSSFPENNFWPIHDLILRTLASEGIRFEQVFIDRSFPEDNLPTRKPGTAMLNSYLNNPEVDLSQSVVIGDRISDVELAVNLSSLSILIADEPHEMPTATCSSWKEIYQFLRNQERKARIVQNTNETRILVDLNLDGSGESSINTGLPFFDHMLDQLARHGKMDVFVQTKGDLEVDEHHTIEDTALALGKALSNALGTLAGTQRYGFCLPMDDALSQVALDFGGRPWLVWDVEFKREKIGDLPTEMFFHFFKSLADAARCNLNIKADGANEHHKIESIFKAFARALRMATARTDDGIPSTKGIL